MGNEKLANGLADLRREATQDFGAYDGSSATCRLARIQVANLWIGVIRTQLQYVHTFLRSSEIRELPVAWDLYGDFSRDIEAAKNRTISFAALAQAQQEFKQNEGRAGRADGKRSLSRPDRDAKKIRCHQLEYGHLTDGAQLPILQISGLSRNDDFKAWCSLFVQTGSCARKNNCSTTMRHSADGLTAPVGKARLPKVVEDYITEHEGISAKEYLEKCAAERTE
jgi:hypothetical protein